MKRVYKASVWHPESIPPEEWKYRQLKRVWLPIYDVIAFFVGVTAIIQGSPLLNRLYDHAFVDLMGLIFTACAVVCFMGVAFPRFWAVEIAGKIVLMSLIAGYATTILLFSQTPSPNHFIVLTLFFALPLPMFRLSLLGEEIKERRALETA